MFKLAGLGLQKKGQAHGTAFGAERRGIGEFVGLGGSTFRVLGSRFWGPVAILWYIRKG